MPYVTCYFILRFAVHTVHGCTTVYSPCERRSATRYQIEKCENNFPNSLTPKPFKNNKRGHGWQNTCFLLL